MVRRMRDVPQQAQPFDEGTGEVPLGYLVRQAAIGGLHARDEAEQFRRAFSVAER